MYKLFLIKGEDSFLIGESSNVQELFNQGVSLFALKNDVTILSPDEKSSLCSLHGSNLPD